MSFNSQYLKIRELVHNELEIIENKMVSLINTREPLNSHIINFLKAPSKRIRPLLSIIFYKSLFGNLDDSQLSALSAVELIHSASLIHDDIIDESNTRRGLKTTANVFGNKLGVISGDYLLSVAMKVVTELGSIELLKNLSNTLNKMCIGEINQNFDRFKIAEIENYIEKSKNKTAYLFESAILAPFFIKEFENINASNFGINVGIAFQIRDDLLNLTNLDISKPVKNDISDGIYNAPIIYGGSVENYLNGVEKTKDLLNNYVNNAYLNIEEIPYTEYKEGLLNFLELLKND